mgnify:CR=1 FL=1
MIAANEVEAYYESIAPFYDLELSDRHDVRFWIDLVRQLRPRQLLEVGAGTGRITIPLARLVAHCGGQVCGLDLSAAMLQHARAKLARSAQPWRDCLRFAQGDLCTFDLGQRFDLVIAADDPFAHLVDDGDAQRAFANVARHLNGGGVFAVEMPLSRGQDIADRRSSRCSVQGERTIVQADRRLDVDMVQSFTPGRKVSRVVFRYQLTDGGGHTLRRAECSFDGRVRRPDELEALFQGAGLPVTTRWGGFDRSPFDPTRSGEMIFVGIKPS